MAKQTKGWAFELEARREAFYRAAMAVYYAHLRERTTPETPTKDQP